MARSIHLPGPLSLALLLLPLALPSQAQEALPVAEVTEDRDRDHVPDRLGDTVTTTGVVTSEPHRIGAQAWIMNLEDPTGGLTLFTRDSTVLAGGLQRGDTLRVRGIVGQYRGIEQLRPLEVRRLGSGPAPQPREVLAADLQAEAHSGRLVRVTGELSVAPTPTGTPVVHLRDRSGQIPIHVRAAYLGDPDFTARLLQEREAEIVGIASQSDREPPFDSGYELVPRDAEDFHFAPIPPYRLLAVLAAILALAILAAYLAVRRRNAERRARVLTVLTEELRRSEEAHRKSEGELRIRTAYLEQLFRSAPEGIALLDVDDRVIRVNEEFLRIFGYREEEVVDRTINSLIVPEDQREEALGLTRKTASGQRIAVETVRQHRDGTPVPVSILATPIELEGRAVAVYGIYRDITGRKEAEEALRESEEQLRQAQKMEAVGRLAGGIAHDFNNLLTVVQGNADLLLMDLPGDSAFREEVEEIRRAADRAAGLTRQLLAFGRKQVLQEKVLDLNRVVEEAGAMLRRLIGADVEFRTVLAPALGCVKADPGQIDQVLVNLVVNARDAMPSGGMLTLATRNVSLDDEYGRSRPEVAPGEYVMLTVSDTGTGMDAATRERIFEPFFTTKEQGKGTGLGLSTVYGIVKQSGGHVAVYSEPGHGSVFRVYLPRVGEGASPDSAPAPVPEPARGSETVLLVEDEAPVRELASRVLARHGYTVLEAQDGEEALRLYEAHDGPIHLLLTDVVMPRMGGPALAAHLSPRHPGLRVLYASGYAGDSVLVGGAPVPEGGFLQKPFAPGELVRKVREVMDRPPPGGAPAG